MVELRLIVVISRVVVLVNSSDGRLGRLQIAAWALEFLTGEVSPE